jgi:hypothetical protein
MLLGCLMSKSLLSRKLVIFFDVWDFSSESICREDGKPVRIYLITQYLLSLSAGRQATVLLCLRKAYAGAEALA